MNFSSIFAQFVALVGGAALRWRQMQGAAPAPAWGNAPAIPAAKPQGALPTLKMPTARGWSDGQKPVAAPGPDISLTFMISCCYLTIVDQDRQLITVPGGRTHGPARLPRRSAGEYPADTRAHQE